MKNLFLFLKGLLIGIGKIIPGVSGSMIAVLLGVYEEAIYAINHMKDDFWKNILFLFPLGVGVLLSAFFFSNLLLFLLSHYYLFTMFFFLGLILGTVPSFRKEFKFNSFKNFFFFFLSFLLPFCLSFFQTGQEFVPAFSLFSFLFIMILGFLDAFSMIIPGISGTAIFLMLGSYSFVLNLFGNPFSQIPFCILFGVGLVLGVFFTSQLVEYCFKKNKNLFFIIIYGFLWSSLCYLLSLVLFQITWSLFLPILFIFCVGYFLSLFFS